MKERGVIVSFDWLVIWSAISEWEGLVFLGVGLGIDLFCLVGLGLIWLTSVGNSRVFCLLLD